jgi:hypothetical protein
MTQPTTVAIALSAGCDFCKKPLTPETALLVTATWQIVNVPETKSSRAAVCCAACFQKYGDVGSDAKNGVASSQ